MPFVPRNAESVKRRRESDHKRKLDLLQFIEIQIEAAHAFASELELYQMWLTHRLVPVEHLAMLLNAEAGRVQ